MMKRLLYIAIICLFTSLPVQAVTYDFYFSNAGGGSACTIGAPCATLAAAETKANAYTAADTVNIHWNRGDTWTCDTAALVGATSCWTLNRGEATVNMVAYGSGADPIFDGLVTDFSTVGTTACPGAPCFTSRFFDFKSPGSITGVEIKRVYGSTILVDSYDGGGCATLDCADGFVLSDSNIHHFGATAITNNFKAGIEDSIVRRTIMHTGQLLDRYYSIGWGAAVSFTASNSNADSMCKNNLVQYNLIYDIHGEGINAPNSTIEYNVVGDTNSIAINTSIHDFDALTTIVRFNILTNSPGGNYGPSTGLRIYDEDNGVGDTNSAGDISVYGNIIINKTYGIRFYCSADCSNPFGVIRIYNNLAIDCTVRNFWVANPEEATVAYVYNNSSIHYDELNEAHTNDSSHANWDFSHNAFYPVDVNDTVGTGWTTNYITGDPVLPGEALGIDWDGLASGDPRNVIDFILHLFPVSGALLAAGTNPGADFATQFLVSPTDFSDVLDGSSAFALAGFSGSWNIGPFGGDVQIQPSIRGIIPVGVTWQ